MKFFAKGLSHGDGYHCKAIGLPADFKINVDRLNEQLALRRAGEGRSARMKSESDRVEFLSGVSADFVTDGRPLEFFIKNKDDGVESKPPITALRSGHADFVGCTALGLKDARYVCERASARRTAAYVAFGEICRQILESKGIFAYYLTRNVGGVKCDAPFDYRNDYSRIKKDDMHCPSDETKQKMLRRIQEARAAGDSVGGSVEVGCVGLPTGLGDFFHYDQKLDGVLAQKMMSIPSVKGVSFGIGAKYADSTNGKVCDALKTDQNGNIFYATNNCGGITAGMTTGGDLKINLTVKPVPTTAKGVRTVDIVTKKTVDSHYERSDVCVVQNVGVIAESILAAAVLDLILKGDAVRYKKFSVDDFDADTLFVTDKKVAEMVDFKGRAYLLPAGEECKDIAVALNLLQYFKDKGANKNTVVVAVGGGAVCDVAGFAAQIYKRGLRFVTVPTTLLAMTDAALGGKNAVNFDGVKNLVGGYNLPEYTVVDFDFLKTNDQRLLQEGFGEIVKYGLLCPSVYDGLKNGDDLPALIKKCVAYKNFVVSADLFDELERKQLNLGHTFGHALESKYKLPHGQAVLNGLCLETLFALRLGVISPQFCKKTLDYIKKYLNKLVDIYSDDAKELASLCGEDKKNDGDKICFVFARPCFDYKIYYVDKKTTEEFLKSVCKTRPKN